MNYLDLGFNRFQTKAITTDAKTRLQWRQEYLDGVLNYDNLSLNNPISSISYTVINLPDQVDSSGFLSPGGL